MSTKRFRSSGPMTLNNWTHEELEHLRNVVTQPDTKIKYICFIQEVGESNTPHLQIYAQASDKLSLKQWHQQLGPRIANIVPTIDIPKAIAYCKGLKDGQPKPGSNLDSVEEYGILPGTDQGKRTDIHQAVEAVTNGKRTYDAIVENPGAIQAYKALQDLERESKRRRALLAVQSEFDNIVWYPWQQGILDGLNQPVHNRKVTWLYEETGNVGKSTLTRYLASIGKAYTPDVSKIQDILYNYNYEPVVIFDIPRSKEEHIDHFYTAIEQFKNGHFTSTKYEPRHMLFKSPHVIVFANFYPNTSKLSMDRWDIIPIVHEAPIVNDPRHDFKPPVDNYFIFDQHKKRKIEEQLKSNTERTQSLLKKYKKSNSLLSEEL